MKLYRLLLPAVLLTLCAACDNDPKDNEDNDWIVFFNDVAAFDNDGAWTYCYDPAYNNTLTFTNNGEKVNFSHEAIVDEWEGVKYYSWKGFCPSNSTDTDDYTGGDWIAHQWAAVPGHGMLKQSNYMIASCDAMQTAADAATSTYVVIKPVETDHEFVPKYAYITNTCYGYYGMKNGTAFSRPFTDSDWCKVTISGVDNGAVTGKVDFYLAKDGKYITEWTPVDLSPLGKCERVVFTMESSDSGLWGMNNPAYFALGAFIWGY